MVHAAIRPWLQDFSRLIEVIIEETMNRLFRLHYRCIQVHRRESEARFFLLRDLQCQIQKKAWTYNVQTITIRIVAMEVSLKQEVIFPLRQQD